MIDKVAYPSRAFPSQCPTQLVADFFLQKQLSVLRGNDPYLGRNEAFAIQIVGTCILTAPSRPFGKMVHEAGQLLTHAAILDCS